MVLRMLSRTVVTTCGKTKKACELLQSPMQNAMEIFELHCSFYQPDGCGYLLITKYHKSKQQKTHLWYFKLGRQLCLL